MNKFLFLLTKTAEMGYTNADYETIERLGTFMSKRFQIAAAVVACLVLVLSTMLGVFAAKQLSALPLGTTVTMEELDKEDSAVGMINFLILGVDEDQSRSDTIMLFCYDGYSNRVNILSFPRDTMTQTGGYRQKLNAAMGVGIARAKSGKDKEPEEEMIRQIKSMTGLPIHYFLTINFDGFKEVIDALGGVDFDVPYNMNYDDPVQNLHIHLNAGQQHLDGQAAHDFVRFRHNNGGSAPGEYVMGDEGRIYWQQKFMQELIRQKATPQIFTKITDVFEVISKSVRTNYTSQDLLKHLTILQKIDVNQIGSYKLPGAAKYVDGISWYIQDETETENLIREVFLPRTAEEWAEQQVKSDTAN